MFKSDIISSFWSRVSIKNKNECWVWNGSGVRYGQIHVNGINYLAHRFSYLINIGKINKGLYVCHSCDNPKCVNPNHLWLGMAKDNTQDMIKKNRHHELKKTHCPYRHPYSGENLYVKPSGKRGCRICIKRDKTTYDTINKNKNKDYSRIYYTKNRVEILKKMKLYRLKNKHITP